MAWTVKMARRARHSETDVPRVLERLDAIMAVGNFVTINPELYLKYVNPKTVAAYGVH